jgi:O-antigen ligase
VFLLSVIGYFFSLHKDQAAFLLERQLSLFLAPVFIPLGISLNIQTVRRLLWVLASACLIANAYLIINLIYKIVFVFHLPFLHTIFGGVFFNHEFSKPLAIHAGYLSLYFAFVIVFLVSELVSLSKFSVKLSLLTAIGFLLIGVFFLASRNTIISMILIFIFIFPLSIIKNKKRYFLLSFLFLFFMGIAVLNVPYLKNRFSKELVLDIKPSQSGQLYNVSVIEPRIERWKGAAQLIAQAPVFGYGTGDEVSMLKTEYAKRGLYISYLEDFNAHNTYLSILLKHGFFGFLLFILMFSFYLRLAFKSRSFLYISFLALFVFGFYTENLFDANKGIVFFAYFNVLLGMYCQREINKSSSISLV